MEGILNENDSSRIAYIIQANVLPQLEHNAFMQGTPHILQKANVCQDGDAWCCSIGENPMVGVFAYGSTPEKACQAFDDLWYKGNAPNPSTVKEESGKAKYVTLDL